MLNFTSELRSRVIPAIELTTDQHLQFFSMYNFIYTDNKQISFCNDTKSPYKVQIGTFLYLWAKDAREISPFQIEKHERDKKKNTYTHIIGMDGRVRGWLQMILSQHKGHSGIKSAKNMCQDQGYIQETSRSQRCSLPTHVLWVFHSADPIQIVPDGLMDHLTDASKYPIVRRMQM